MEEAYERTVYEPVCPVRWAAAQSLCKAYSHLSIIGTVCAREKPSEPPQRQQKKHPWMWIKQCLTLTDCFYLKFVVPSIVFAL